MTDQKPAYERPPAGLDRAYRSLLKDMHLALLSEIGARSIYDHLGRIARDPELSAILERLNQQGADSVARLRELMQGMGARPRRTSFRRRAMARALAWASRLTGMRPALRICQNAEETVSRWYAEYEIFLTRIGDTERARACGELARIKRLHAQALAAWVANIRRRSR